MSDHRGADRDAFERGLVERARREGTPAARRAAVEGMLPRARQLARRFYRGDEPLEDLEQVAALGLLKAIDGFDLSRGTPFGSYAVPTIVGELRRHFRDKGWTIRVPRDLQELSIRVGKEIEVLSPSLGRSPTPAELADRLGTTVEQVCEVYQLTTAMRPVSLDRPMSLDPQAEPVTLGMQLGSVDPEYERADAAVTTHALLKRLPDRERQIVQLRFADGLTQAEISEQVGISPMQVSRLLRRSLEQLLELVET